VSHHHESALPLAAAQATERAWAQLGDDLRRYLRRRVSDEHLADDLLQETFLRIHRSIDSLQDEPRLAAWVYQIARNVVRDHYRRRARSAMTVADLQPPDEPHDTPQPPLGPAPGQALRWLEEFVRLLPESLGQAVRMSELEGLPQQEVAARLGISLAAAKSRIQRGRAALRTMLQRCCTFEFDRRGNVIDYDRRRNGTTCPPCDRQADDVLPPPARNPAGRPAST
jgi:RNA polymerase sigma-70 factor (ECF subfamily)